MRGKMVCGQSSACFLNPASGDFIELYLARYEDFDLYALDEALHIPKLYRYRLDLRTEGVELAVEEKEVSPIPVEFPVV
jgi:hypothetical protein